MSEHVSAKLGPQRMTTPALRLIASPYPPGTRHPLHAHDELQITLVLRGQLQERVGSRMEEAGALSVVVKDPGVMHADDFASCGALTARLSLDRSAFADLVEHPARAVEWCWLHDGFAAKPFLRLVQRGLNGERKFCADDDDILDLVAVISARRSTTPSRQPPMWLRDVVARITDAWQPGLTVRDVAASVGVHPVYLARCLRRWFGVSGGELLRRARLRRAAHAVADGAVTVSTVAHDTGFTDESHLWREFSRMTGVTPAQFRRLGRAFEQRGFANTSLPAR
jgi:AraC family transcriptional regulator